MTETKTDLVNEENIQDILEENVIDFLVKNKNQDKESIIVE